MDRDHFMRRVLQASFLFNLGGATVFAFPASVGQLMGLPVPVPRIYSVLLALFALQFGGAYAWLARQPSINRPLVGFTALGKASFFFTMFLCWIAGIAPGLGVIGATGDLIFAALFAWWLFGAAR